MGLAYLKKMAEFLEAFTRDIFCQIIFTGFISNVFIFQFFGFGIRLPIFIVFYCAQIGGHFLL